MLDVILWIMLLAVLGGAGFVGWVFLNGQISGFGGGTGLFRPKGEKRLDIVDQTSLDARRRLVLIRRDGVEHLIMTGGPVDVVIETGIGDTSAAAATPYGAQPRLQPVTAQPAPQASQRPLASQPGAPQGSHDTGFSGRPARSFGGPIQPTAPAVKAAE